MFMKEQETWLNKCLQVWHEWSNRLKDLSPVLFSLNGRLNKRRVPDEWRAGKYFFLHKTKCFELNVYNLSYIKYIHGLSFREKKENSVSQLSKNVFVCSRNLSFLSLFLLHFHYFTFLQ